MKEIKSFQERLDALTAEMPKLAKQLPVLSKRANQLSRRSLLPPAKWRRLPKRFRTPLIVTFLLLVAGATVVGFLFLLYERSFVPEPFPVSVNPALSLIEEDPSVEEYYLNHIGERDEEVPRQDWLDWLSEKLFDGEWYQLLAAPRARNLVIYAGERREEVADSFGDILRWNDEERERFLTLVASSSPSLTEGKYFPDHYLVDKEAPPEYVAALVNERFSEEVLSRYRSDAERQVSLEDTLIIASLLEREAYDFTDMREISGVIWNRLFEGMNLQLDATLQYAKGNLPYGPWWPAPLPRDKFIDSPYNTYQNEGLPPGPIANPSLEAVLAALNPIETDCLFYFHSTGGSFHCSPTYEEHVGKLRAIYGRGR